MEADNYGFIVGDKSADLSAGEDIFFHYDDIKRTNLSRSFLKTVRDQFLVRVRFRLMAYQGKYKQSKKAVDIELIKIEPLNGQQIPSGLPHQQESLDQEKKKKAKKPRSGKNPEDKGQESYF